MLKGVKKNQIRLELCKKRGLVFEINVFFYFWRVFRHNVGVHIVYNFAWNQVVPYNNDSTASRLLSEVKHCLARLVLRWGTTLESREYYFFFSHSYHPISIHTSMHIHAHPYTYCYCYCCSPSPSLSLSIFFFAATTLLPPCHHPYAPPLYPTLIPLWYMKVSKNNCCGDIDIAMNTCDTLIHWYPDTWWP